MANIKSAKKRVKMTEIRTARNNSYKSAVKTAIKRFEEALTAGNKEKAETALVNAVKKVDQAATKGLFHKNKAAHKKSQLQLAFTKTFKAS